MMQSANDLSQLSDSELWQHVMQGDESSFVALYRRRQSAVYRFALRMSGSASIAEDVTQEVFLALMREGGRFDPTRSSLASYLYGIARNQVLRRLERERNFAPWPESEHEPDEILLVDTGNPLGDLTRQETVDAVRQAVLALPPHYREVVVLCDLHEMSYLETAESLGCAVGTVRSRLHRARALLVGKLRALHSTEKVAAATVAAKPEFGQEFGQEFGVRYEMRGV
jgi:RNA polymerase sigma-70 factor, ECF subfamily